MQFCKPPWADENMIGFVSCNPRFFSHMATLHQPDGTGKEGKMI